MARKDALLRLHQRLVTQRNHLRKKLADELGIGHREGEGHSDVGDVAWDDTEKAINSEIASLETRELKKFNRAIEAIREGRYGKCEACERSIPIARLRALPYTTVCVSCQEEFEAKGITPGEHEDWEQAFQFEVSNNDRELSMRDIERGLSSS